MIVYTLHQLLPVLTNNAGLENGRQSFASYFDSLIPQGMNVFHRYILSHSVIAPRRNSHGFCNACYWAVRE